MTKETLLDVTAAPQPPWVRYPEQPPWWGGFRQGDAEIWYLRVFLPFWTHLSGEQRVQYLARWPADEEWGETLTRYAARGPIEPHRPDFALHPPPWHRYPDRGPSSLLWRVGRMRRWLDYQFLPFWFFLPEQYAAGYLEFWPPPSEAWRERLQRWRRGL